MPDWGLFAGVTVVLSLGFVVLARASARALTAALDDPGIGGVADRLDSGWLIAENVLASHGLLVLLLLGAAWLAEIPGSALGIDPPTAGTVGLGAGLGLALAAGNEASVRAADRYGLEHDERLRALLTPDSPAGWARLLLVVLPLVAVAEELLFRGAFIGSLAAGFGLPVVALAAVSSVLFGLGHGLQGRVGVVVTTGLGGVLAAAFVLTGSLAVVVVAHYVVNAVEFVVNERPGSRG